jgi:signal transduction histidine kinase
VFKSKKPRRYIQVKTRVINQGRHIIAICSDITKFKDSEIRMQKVRSRFFSSVAHELRTPLNAIIPILRMVIMILSTVNFLPENILKSLKIVLSSALHLQNVIEDCLEISRIENNKFSLYKEKFDIREAANEVCDIMKFQIEQKGL